MNNHKSTRLAALLCGIVAISTIDPAFAQGRSEGSPAAAPIPETLVPQTYAPELVEAGRVRFAADCGFCHGRDAAGATGGADLTRSQLVAEDVRGDRIGEVVRSGRLDLGMPAFPTIADADLEAIVAFIHDQKAAAESATGGRRSVEVADLQTGSSRAGRRYFDRHCADCHSASGDLADIGARLEGLDLLRRMLYPGSEGRGIAAPPRQPTVALRTRDGAQQFSGSLAWMDEFTIAVVDAAGRYRSWPVRSVTFEIDDPREAHVAQLAIYTDEDIHDVFAYLQSLRGE